VLSTFNRVIAITDSIDLAQAVLMAALVVQGVQVAALDTFSPVYSPTPGNQASSPKYIKGPL